MVVLTGVYTAYFMGLILNGSRQILALIGVASTIGVTFNVFLINAAMEPIRVLEATARVRIRALAADVIRIGDQERADFAKKVHASTENALQILINQLQAARRDSLDKDLATRLENMHTIANNILHDVRSIVYTVHPNLLNEVGLLAALESMAESINRWSVVSVEARFGEGTPDDVKSLPHSVASVLARVAQEAVHNALKHANAHHVIMTLDVTSAAVVLRVADDGKGFDVREVIHSRTGDSDLLGLCERLTLVGGTFEVTSIPSQGTYLCASIPLNEHALPSQV